jgi:hypothetical protein
MLLERTPKPFSGPRWRGDHLIRLYGV